LDSLDSYTFSLRVSFKGTREGAALDKTDLYTRTFSLSPPAQFTTIQTTDDDGKPVTLMQGFSGTVQYARAGLDEPCAVRARSATGGASFNPVVLLTPILQGNDKGPETVNGVPARHYVMDAVRNSNTQMSGEVWIAEPGAFVVKYALRVQGGEAYFGKGSEGEQTLAFEVREAGARKPVALPSGCPPPVVDLPAMADAANVTRSLSKLSYTTASGIAATEAFYREQMKALGWTLESNAAPSEPPIAAQPPAGMGAMPNLPANLPPLPPGINLKDYVPTAVPTRAVAAPVARESWMVFARAGEPRRAYITLRVEGASVRVTISQVVE
jgi:hypothetical protein